MGFKTNGVKRVVKYGVKNDVKRRVRQRGYSCSRHSTLAHAFIHVPVHDSLHAAIHVKRGEITSSGNWGQVLITPKVWFTSSSNCLNASSRSLLLQPSTGWIRLATVGARERA